MISPMLLLVLLMIQEETAAKKDHDAKGQDNQRYSIFSRR
jgi:hypothetical protein